MKFDLIGIMNKAAFYMKQHGPEIMVFCGAAGAVTAGVMACCETTHLPDVKQNTRKRLENVRSMDETDPARGRMMAKAYIENGLEYAKLYAPSCIVGTLSITSILAGNHILKQRNIALAAAYATIDTSYKQYRHRVAERYGEEAEREIRNGVTVKTVKETVTDENGKTHEEERTVVVSQSADEFSRYFEQGTTKAWEPSHEYNMFFLKLQQRIINDQLRANGYVFLNDVYQMLGYQRTKAGQVVGWVYDPNNADKYANDNYIDFRIQEITRPGNEFEDEVVETILLDFNVDGPIVDHVCKNHPEFNIC